MLPHVSLYLAWVGAASAIPQTAHATWHILVALAGWFAPALAGGARRVFAKGVERQPIATGDVIAMSPLPGSGPALPAGRQTMLAPALFLLTLGIHSCLLAGAIASRVAGWLGAVVGWCTRDSAASESPTKILPAKALSPLQKPQG